MCFLKVLVLLLIGLVLMTSPMLGQPAEKLTLNLPQCEAMALRNNPLVRAAELGLESSRARKVLAANAAILPKMELRNIWTPVPRARAVFTEAGVLTSPDTSTGLSDLRMMTDFDFSLIQPIYTFGKISSLSRAADFGIEASQANIEKTAAEVRLLTRRLFWGLVFGRELQTVIEDVLKEVNKAEEKLNEKLDEDDGSVAPEDLYKLKIFKYEITKKYRETLKEISLAQAGMRAALGLAADAEFVLDIEYLDPIELTVDSLAAYLEMALQHRPELHQLQAALGADRAMIDLARSDYYPQIFLGGGVRYNFAPGRDDPKNPWVYNPTNFLRPSILLGFQINLNFRQTADRVRLAQAQHRELTHKERLLVEKIKLDVQKKYQDLREAQRNMRDSEQALKVSERWLRSVTMTFDLGLAEVKDLIDAFKANSTMRGEHLNNIYRFNVAVAELSKEVGVELYQR